MAWKAWENGDQAHHCNPHFCRPDQRRRRSVQEYRRYVYLLQQGLRELGCGLELRAGMEVFATAELPKLLDRQEVLTLADSRYLLVEFYFDERGDYMDDALRLVADRGYVPVVAHPGGIMRYKGIRPLAASWFRRGCILQLNKGTILGHMGAASKQTAWWLLERDLPMW